LTAEIALTKAGIKSATPTYQSVPIGQIGSGVAAPVAPIKPGSVIAQWPAAGTRVDQTTKVRLTAAK
jgi:beta-lactam-binding protein with PASTA domain